MDDRFLLRWRTNEGLGSLRLFFQDVVVVRGDAREMQLVPFRVEVLYECPASRLVCTVHDEVWASDIKTYWEELSSLREGHRAEVKIAGLQGALCVDIAMRRDTPHCSVSLVSEAVLGSASSQPACNVTCRGCLEHDSIEETVRSLRGLWCSLDFPGAGDAEL